MSLSHSPGAGQTQGAPPSNTPKRRGRTFTGCWTCRARRLKCDEGKPTCKRCEQSSYECEGYAIRLAWNDNQGPSGFRAAGDSAARKRRLPIDADQEDDAVTCRLPNNGGTSAAHLGTLGDDVLISGESALNARQGEVGRGGSGIAAALDHCAIHEPNSAAWVVATPSSKVPDQASPGLASAPALSWPTQPVDGTALDVPVTTRAPIHELTPDTSGFGHPVDASGTPLDLSWLPAFNEDSYAINTPRATSQGFQRDRQPQPGSRHLDILPDPARQCMLLEHWVLVVCDMLSVMPGIYSPLRTIFTSLALEGAREYAATSTGAVALFHLVCSISGFHIAEHERSLEAQRAFKNLALEHHNLGIAHMGRNIRSDDKNQRVAILASLILCLYHEAITMHDPRWRLHIKGALNWVNQIDPEFWYQSDAAFSVHQMFLALAIFTQSQLLPGDPEGCGVDIHCDFESQPKAYVLDTICGVSQPVLQAVHKMNCILQQRDGRQTPADGGRWELDRLHMEMLLMTPQPPPLDMKPEHGRLMYHHQNAFYYAALLYMKRTLKNIPVSEVQGLVEQALGHVEALHATTTENFSPLTWPIAMIAFETHSPPLQKRMLRCLERLSRPPCLAIWSKFTESVQGLWARRHKPEEANLGWQSYDPLFHQTYMLV